VDLNIDSTTTEIMKLALNGLSARHKAITSNVANADTNDYKRVGVNFEDQLTNILSKEYEKKSLKEYFSADIINTPQNNANSGVGSIGLDANLMRFNVLNNENSFKSFNPEVAVSEEMPKNLNGNTVNIEKEMSELSKNGMRYNAITQLLSKKYKGLGEIIKSGGG
jgi:flagellar basal-body rod protein FlgB